MSRASEWAKKIQAMSGDAPAFRLPAVAGTIAGVTVSPTSVGLQLNSGDLTTEDALALADWINDTFREQP